MGQPNNSIHADVFNLNSRGSKGVGEVIGVMHWYAFEQFVHTIILRLVPIVSPTSG